MTGDQQPPDEVDELTSGLFATLEYQPGQPPPRKFHPWHRPRKQFVRREQWARLAELLLPDRRTSEPLRYLGLPGVDLVDLRYLYHRVCAGTDLGFRFLGFTSEARAGNAAHIDLHTSLDEVLRLDNVDQRSDVLGDDFRSLGRDKSIARDRLQLLGPFDIVNLDLCDGLATDSPGKKPSIYDALGHLVALQARNPDPWLLFITTRMGRIHFDAEAQARLLAHYISNIESCEDFSEACREGLGVDDPASLDVQACPDDIYFRLMLLSLCKWLLVLTRVAPTRVQLASSQSYKVEPAAGCHDLVSFALRIDPVIAAPLDPLSPANSAVVVDECADAARMARRIARVKDVDAIVSENAQLMEELIAETEDLLRQARYDVSGFRPWLAADAVTLG